MAVRESSRPRRNQVVASFLCLALALGGAGGGTGCAVATNYLDPTGPVYRQSGDRALSAQPDALRIVTFNIEFGRRVERAAEALRSHPELKDADIVALQEMSAAGVEIIARALGMNYVYYPLSLHPRAHHDFGNAVLSRWPIEESRKLLLPHLSRFRRQVRGATVARVRVGSLGVAVYSVHLGAPFTTTGRHRREQAAAVLADARTIGGPVIVAGDMNSSEVGGEFEREGFTWATKGIGATVRRFSYDHVFVRGLGSASASSGAARDVKDASDHRPVWVVMRDLKVFADVGLAAHRESEDWWTARGSNLPPRVAREPVPSPHDRGPKDARITVARRISPSTPRTS